MSRKALINDSTGFVVNVIEHEDDSDWTIPNGHSLIDAVGKGGPGDTWNGNNFIKPEPGPLDPNDVALKVLEDKLRKKEPTTLADLKEMYRLRFLT